MPWEFAPEMRTSRRPKIATTDGPRPRGDVSYPAADAGSDRCGSEPSGAADLRAGGAMTGSSVRLTTCAAGPFAPGRAPQHGTATLAPLLTLAAPVSYTHLRAHETGRNLVCRLLLEKKK